MAKFLSILLLLAAVISLQWSNAEIVAANANNGVGDDAMVSEQGLVDELLQLPQENGVPLPPGAARKPMSKNLKLLIGVTAAALLALLGGGGYFAYSKFLKDDGEDKEKGDGVDGPATAAAIKPRSEAVGLD